MAAKQKSKDITIICMHPAISPSPCGPRAPAGGPRDESAKMSAADFCVLIHDALSKIHHNTVATTNNNMDPVKRVEEIRGSILNDTQVVNGCYKFGGAPPCWPSEIVKGWLYLGGSVHASNPNFVKESGLMHVLNCADMEARGITEGVRYRELCAQDSMRYKLLSLHMEEAHEFLREAGSEPILVHCHAGMNRSVALVVSYLMVYGPNPPTQEEAKSSGELCMSFDEAVRYVLEKRPYALSNPNFVKQLSELEQEWQKEVAPPSLISDEEADDDE